MGTDADRVKSTVIHGAGMERTVMNRTLDGIILSCCFHQYHHLFSLLVWTQGEKV